MAHTAGTLSGQAPRIASWLLPAPIPSTGISGSVSPAGLPVTAGTPQVAPENTLDAEEVVHPFNNPSLPPITSRLLKVIKAGGYVDLGDLLPEALAEAFDRGSLRGDKEDTASRKRWTITSLGDWGLAFSTFAAASTHYHPSKAAQLLAYSGIIFRLAREVGGSAWQRYDRAFRQAAAVNPALAWDRREPDIWLTSLAGESHSRAAGSSSAALPRKRPSGTEACLRWNWGSCYSTPCRYLHKCIQCQSYAHPAKRCPQAAPRNSSDTRGSNGDGVQQGR